MEELLADGVMGSIAGRWLEVWYLCLHVLPGKSCTKDNTDFGPYFPDTIVPDLQKFINAAETLPLHPKDVL